MQGVEAGGAVSLAFTIHPSDLSAARALAETLAAKYAGSGVQLDDTLARVSVVGVGMRSHSGVAATLFQALARERINIENVTTSEIVISALVPAADAQRALQAVHAAFGLDRA
jgi:aspartate kinase